MVIIIMICKFVNRKWEFEVLEEFYNRGVNLIVVYGWRRVGKIIFFRKFFEGKRGIYFLCF